MTYDFVLTTHGYRNILQEGVSTPSFRQKVVYKWKRHFFQKSKCNDHYFWEPLWFGFQTNVANDLPLASVTLSILQKMCDVSCFSAM